MAYPHRLSQVVTNTNESVIIKGKVIRTRLKTQIDREGFHGSPDYKAWRIILGDPKIVKGAKTQLGQELAKVDDTSKGFQTDDYDDNYKTVIYLESKLPNGLPLIDGKTNQQVTDANGNPLRANEALKGELASDEDLEVAVRMIPTNYGGNMMVIDAVCVPDFSKVKYYQGGSTQDFGSLFGTPKGSAPVAQGASAGQPAAKPAKPEADSDDESSDDQSVDQLADDLFGDDE